jgi:hypothetical protein
MLKPLRKRWRQVRRAFNAPAQRIAQGEGGERALQDWLDRSRLPYLFLDQTPLTMPTAHRSNVKRPDFLVAVDGIGTVAVDAKAKAFIDGCLTLDASERRRLNGFEATFEVPVWYACFPPDQPRLAYLFRNSWLFHREVRHDDRRQVILAPLRMGFAVEPAATSFAKAIYNAGAHVPPCMAQE